VVGDLNANGANSIYYNNPALHGTPVYTAGGPPCPYARRCFNLHHRRELDTLNLPLLQGGAERVEASTLALITA